MKASEIPSAAPVAAVTPQPASLASAAPQNSGGNFSEIMGRALAANDSESASDDSGTTVESDPSKNHKTSGPDDQSVAPALEILAALSVAPILPQTAVAASTAAGTDAVAAIGGSSNSKSDTAPDAATLAEANLPEVNATSTAAMSVPTTATGNASSEGTAKESDVSISALADSLRPLKDVPQSSIDTKTAGLSKPPAPLSPQPAPTWTGSAAADTPAELPAAGSGKETPLPTPSNPVAESTAAATEVAEQKLPVEVKGASTAIPFQIEANTLGKAASAVDPAIAPNAARPLEVAGTSGANYRSPMQKAEKVNNFTGSTEQKLPVTATATGASISVKPAKAAGETLDSSKDASVAIGSSFSATDNSASVDSRVDQIFPNTAARSVERAHDLIALHAMRLRDSGRDSMQIVIKPSPDLHLALNLQNRDGAIEVTAQLQRGDYELLNRHWSDLQQQMESRGVRLAPLSNQNQSAGGSSSGSSFSQPRQSPEEKATRSGAFAEFALAGVLVPKRTATKTTAPRGWESWA